MLIAHDRRINYYLMHIYYSQNHVSMWKERRIEKIVFIDTQLYHTIYSVVSFQSAANVPWYDRIAFTVFFFLREECAHKSSSFYCLRCE